MKPLFFPSPAAWRKWLAAHHASADELWVGYWKRATGKPSLTWPESVDEALCYGWIDGLRKSIDDESYMIRFTPRRKGSIWSAVNLARVKALTAAGRMRPAGLKVHNERVPGKDGRYSFEQPRNQSLAPAYLRRLKANPKAKAYWASAAPYYKRVVTHWVMSAKKEETRERRLQALISDSAKGMKIGPLRALEKAKGSKGTTSRER